MTDRTGRWAVHLRLLGMAVLWGGSWPAARVLATALPPLAVSAWRFGLSVLLFAIWWRFSRGHLGALRQLQPRQWLGLALAGLVGVFGYAVFFMYGVQQVAAGRASLIVTVNPVFTTLIAAWWFKERFNATIAVGMALATLGATVVLTQGEPWKLLVGGIGLGEWLLLGCITCWVGYTLLGRRLLAGIDALTATSVASVFGGLMLIAASAFVEGPQALAAPLHASALQWAALLGLAGGATVLAYAWYFDGVAQLGAGGASAYISLVPVFGVASSTLWLKEELSPSLLAGGALAVCGMLLMNWARR